jgi:hypothetical protein
MRPSSPAIKLVRPLLRLLKRGEVGFFRLTIDRLVTARPHEFIVERWIQGHGDTLIAVPGAGMLFSCHAEESHQLLQLFGLSS